MHLSLIPSHIHSPSLFQMVEDGQTRTAAPECLFDDGQLGWVYWNGHCYLFASFHTPFFRAEEMCNEVIILTTGGVDDRLSFWVV